MYDIDSLKYTTSYYWQFPNIMVSVNQYSIQDSMSEVMLIMDTSVPTYCTYARCLLCRAYGIYLYNSTFESICMYTISLFNEIQRKAVLEFFRKMLYFHIAVNCNSLLKVSTIPNVFRLVTISPINNRMPQNARDHGPLSQSNNSGRLR